MTTNRQYVAAYQADNGNIIAVTTPNAVREYAEQDAKALQLDPMEIFVAYRDMPEWQRVDRQDPSPNVMCACGDLINICQPNVEAEADGVLWHGNADDGGHRADVKLP